MDNKKESEGVFQKHNVPQTKRTRNTHKCNTVQSYLKPIKLNDNENSNPNLCQAFHQTYGVHWEIPH